MNNMQRRFKNTLVLATFFVLLFTHVLAQNVFADDDLTSLSLEDLVNVNITSVSKRPQKLIDAAFAIYVITQEDIRRSGATNIPDALRRVPGIQVAHINANTWAITSRGLNSFLSNKLLVLIDGRSVYTPLFSGVYWDVQDTLLTRTISDDSEFAGYNVLTRWKHTFSESSNLELQLYYDRTERESITLREDRDTYDIDFQHRFKFGKRQDMMWGLGYRLTHDNIRNSFIFSFNPESRDMPLYSGFVHDEITLLEDKLRLTVGSKLSYNAFTGLEIQPNARLLWKPRKRHSTWLSWSRAVRTPSRGENDVRLNNSVDLSTGALVALFGDHGFDSEVLYSYELGYRFAPSGDLSVDIAMYYNNYDKLLTLEPGTPFLETLPTPAHIVSPFIARNEMDGEVFGMEMAVDWWHLKGSYSYQQILMHLNKSSLDTVSETVEGSTPHNMFFIRSSFDLPGNIELDLSPCYTDTLPSVDVDSYVELDARLAWKPFENLEISLIGQHLLDTHHPEFKQGVIVSTGSTEIERLVFF